MKGEARGQDRLEKTYTKHMTEETWNKTQGGKHVNRKGGSGTSTTEIEAKPRLNSVLNNRKLQHFNLWM